MSDPRISDVLYALNLRSPQNDKEWSRWVDAHSRARAALVSIEEDLASLRAGRDTALHALQVIEPIQQFTLGAMESNGFVFATPLDKPDSERTEAERWEKLAFTIYSRLCEVDSIVRGALSEAGVPQP